jgi:hypothetical protein
VTYPHRSRQASNIKTSQSGYCQLCSPDGCRSQCRRTIATSKKFVSPDRFSESTPATSKVPCRIYNIANNYPEELTHVVAVLEKEFGKQA